MYSYGKAGLRVWWLVYLWIQMVSGTGNNDCDFEKPCSWIINGSYAIIPDDNATASTYTKLDYDGTHNKNGHYLASHGNITLTSPLIHSIDSRCVLKFDLHQINLDHWDAKVYVKTKKHTVEARSFPLYHNAFWVSATAAIAAKTSPFQVEIEVIPSTLPTSSGPRNYGEKHQISIDNLKFSHCKEDVNSNTNPLSCEAHQYRCEGSQTCIDNSLLCDFTKDCPAGDDELREECQLMPSISKCTFEDGWCGWKVKHADNVQYYRLITSKNITYDYQPLTDHTTNTSDGHYACALGTRGSLTTDNPLYLTSPRMPPLGYYHSNNESDFYRSCHIRFFLYKHERYKVSMMNVIVRELDTRRNQHGPERVLWSIKDDKSFKVNRWHRVNVALPVGMRHTYEIVFRAQPYYKLTGCLGLDDISLSPECFGIGVPTSEIREFPKGLFPEEPEKLHPGNVTRKYEFSTCGTFGRVGPEPSSCSSSYSQQFGDNHPVVLTKPPFKGVQVWKIPHSGLYTIFALGASGGAGTENAFNSEGALIRVTFRFKQGDRLFMLVGQKGSDACRDSDSNVSKLHKCLPSSPYQNRHGRSVTESRLGGGGGGGATYVFMEDPDSLNKSNPSYIPLIIAGGGGGASASKAYHRAGDKEDPNRGSHATGFVETLGEFGGNGISSPSGDGAGSGGGWVSGVSDNSMFPVNGRSLADGAVGGRVCNYSHMWRSDGGFGGGGGGCIGGGGGGGWKGGDASLNDRNNTNGLGGNSFIMSKLAMDKPSIYKGGELPANLNIYGKHTGNGNGFIIIIAADDTECPCSELCLPVDLATRRPTTENPNMYPLFSCACKDPQKQPSHSDDTICVIPDSDSYIKGQLIIQPHHLIILVLSIFITLAVIFFFFIVGFVRCPLRKNMDRESQHLGRRDHSSAELQLSRLRQQTGMVTEYNPNYEFGGSTCTLHDLPEIPRESLTLVKALGQGAFGEVYQGVLTRYNGEISEMSVAVKTLPELSSADSEKDFITEACIMSKFQHQNIVTFIGVCFDRMPRFIVLELLSGGDLKSFLRESRPKPNRPSTLNMTDLLLLAVDVAKGCQYLEEKHFIHRDIAARNCLLTSKTAPDRKVKIADFGMARDIYRADYYRKGGKAMLPVKWMPPEAFLDGMFTSKTDVWSFGVLLWEVMSMGYMPYPGRGNQEVMQLVTSGGRLEPPVNCPGPVYHIMTQCWNPIAEERPCFSTILERLGYCLQDPDVTSVQLPMFQRAPSVERDTTVMRQSKEQISNDSAPLLQSPLSTEAVPTSPLDDYMVPMGQYHHLSNDFHSASSAVLSSPMTQSSIDSLIAGHSTLNSPSIPAPPPPQIGNPHYESREFPAHPPIPLEEIPRSPFSSRRDVPKGQVGHPHSIPPLQPSPHIPLSSMHSSTEEEHPHEMEFFESPLHNLHGGEPLGIAPSAENTQYPPSSSSIPLHHQSSLPHSSTQSTYPHPDEPELPILEPLMSQGQPKKPYANVHLDRRKRLNSAADSFNEISC